VQRHLVREGLSLVHFPVHIKIALSLPRTSRSWTVIMYKSCTEQPGYDSIIIVLVVM